MPPQWGGLLFSSDVRKLWVSANEPWMGRREYLKRRRLLPSQCKKIKNVLLSPLGYNLVDHFPNAANKSQTKSFVMPLPACPRKGEVRVHHGAEPAKRKHGEDVMYHRETREFWWFRYTPLSSVLSRKWQSEGQSSCHLEKLKGPQNNLGFVSNNIVLRKSIILFTVCFLGSEQTLCYILWNTGCNVVTGWVTAVGLSYLVYLYSASITISL